ncbi:Thioredoxin-like [Mucilaginibacter pineti]|uniref:Thioredoxin-like n=2 Tax=Mucilaginibacter pineti TaxID=1391627 RepID=A0A1G7GBP9_9SPHI|nr:Thioredoxin-like [Mucilaginibacter pineti]
MLLCLMPLFAGAQKKVNINFQVFNTWDQVTEQAAATHKNIFIDVYATWCGPCKKMDEEVYTDPVVAKFVNENFIAVKIQIDRTDKDPVHVKKWYETAKRIRDQYHIDVLPTFLFISDEGNLVERGAGYQDKKKFMQLLMKAADPEKCYASLIEQFRLDKLKGDALLSLALLAKTYHDDSIALSVARLYKQHVIDNTPALVLLNPRLLQYMYEFYELFSINDPVVLFMYQHPEQADSLLNNKGYAVRFTDYLISKYQIHPIIRPGGKYVKTVPDWGELQRKVTNAYDPTTAERLLTDARIEWYSAVKDWPNIIRYTIEKKDKQGLDTAGLGAAYLNNFVFDVIFKHSNEMYALHKGIQYMEMLLKNNPGDENAIDTYANVLYKAGRKQEAIKQEKRALALAGTHYNNRQLKVFQDTLDKMQKGEPTWP